MEQQDLIDSGVTEIASSLGIEPATEPEVPAEEAPVEAAPDAEGSPDEPVKEVAAEAPATRQAPKSWAKEMHEKWATLPPDVQDYLEKREQDFHKGLEQYKGNNELGRTMNDIIAPYRPMIHAAGIDEGKAVAALLNAHYRLTQGPIEQRIATYKQLGRDLGFGAQEQAADGTGAQIPEELQREIMQIKEALSQTQRAAYQERLVKVTSEVEAFRSKNPYFDDVATEMAAFIGAGDDMQAAYDKAVRANPSTYAKEQARLEKEIEDRIRKKANEEAKGARRATAANVTGRDTTRTPTEPKGKFLDERTMAKDLEEILARQTH